MAPILQHIKEITEKLLKKLNVNLLNVDVSEDKDDIIRVNISSDDSQLIIGWHGETLNALQHLVKSLVWKINEDNKYFIIVDVEEYRKRQEDNVIKLAEMRAQKVLNSGDPAFLPPMSPYFRKIIHIHLASSDKYQKLATESVGEGQERKIKILMKQ